MACQRSRVVLLLSLVLLLLGAGSPVAQAAPTPTPAASPPTKAPARVSTPSKTSVAASTPGKTYTVMYVKGRNGRRPLTATLTRTLPAPVAPPKAPGAARPAVTTTYTITSTADSHDANPGDGRCADSGGACTLRAAIEEANADPSGSTLTLTVPAGTYSLTLGQLLVSGQSTITLNGAGSSSTTITANNASRVFEVLSGVTLTMNGVTITGGNAQDDGGGGTADRYGGGIYNSGNLTLNNSAVTLNQASSQLSTGQAGGGGIDSVGPANSLTLNNTQIDRNTSSTPSTGTGYANGGGIAEFGGTLSVTNQSGITGNLTQDGDSDNGQGGGLILDSATTTIADSSITGNIASEGGGISNNLGTSTTLTNVYVAGNKALVFDGAGIENYDNLTITGNSISNNTTSHDEGAGLFTCGSLCGLTTTLSLSGVTISGNTANGTTGGQYADGFGAGLSNEGSTVTITSSTITGNTALEFGGGIENGTGSLTVLNSTINNNQAQTSGGGGINNEAMLTLTNSTIMGNTGSFAGGLENLGSASATITGSTFASNHGYIGGLENSQSSTLSLTNSTITGNDGGDEQSGFNAALDSQGQLTFTNVTFAGNGGGIYNYPGYSLAVRNSIIANTTGGPNCGGAITDQGYNLDSGSSCGFSQATDLQNTNPLLGPLASNGGPTQTMALQAGSPAIDAGGTSANGCPATDQRGVSRPQGAACDIGAYEAPAGPPAVTSLTPNGGPASGGTQVTVGGTGFAGATGVTFGPTAGSSLVVVSPTKIVITSPAAGAPGTVDVRVTTPFGTSPVVAADRFTYCGPPTVSGVSPNSGTDQGGMTVTISGVGFTGATAVHFGVSAATSFTVKSDGSISAVAPAGQAGIAVDVTVTGPCGVSPVNAPADQYTYTAPAPPTNGDYHPLTPVRILDTRPGSQVGPFGSPFTTGLTRCFVVAGQGGVPASGVAAVVLNTAVTDTNSPGFLTLYPSGQTRPTASNLNWSAGETIPNLVIVPVGTDGEVCLYNALGNADAVIDLEGWFDTSGAAMAGHYQPLAPKRILDTRPASQIGPFNTRFTTGQTRLIPITGQGGVPSSGVAAVILNVAVTDTDSPGFLTAYPTGQARPTASNLNWSAGQTIPNRVIVPVGSGGEIDLYNALGDADVIIDVNGWFSDGTAQASSVYSPLPPARILDTRPASQVGSYNSPFGTGTTRAVLATNIGGVANATAVVLDAAVTDTNSPGFLTLYPTGISRPNASDLNWLSGITIANLAVTQVGSDGQLNVYNALGNADVVLDVEGYFH